MSIVNVEALKGLGAQLWWPGAVASTNALKAITANGDVKQILPFPGAGIGMFDGTGDYIDVTYDSDFIFGASDFQIDVWVYRVGSGDACIFRIPNAGTYSPVSIVIISGKVTILLSTDGSSWANGSNYTWGSTLSLNTWYHVRVVRSGSNFYGYLNGVQDWTYTGALTLFTSVSGVKIGGYPSEYYLNGYVSELRLKIGSSTVGAFTPPRCQLESDSNTKLLLHFNRNDTTFIDSSPSAHTITVYGDAKQLCSPCGSGIAYFDGNGDYLHNWTISDTGGNISINLYICLNSSGTNNILMQHGWPDPSAGAAAMRIGVDSGGKLYYQYTGIGNWGWTTVIDSVAATWLNVFNHIRFVRSGTTAYLFINGLLRFTGSIPVYAGCVSSCHHFGLGFGHTDWVPNAYTNGYISEFLITKNPTYITTTNFTPPTQPFAPDPYTKVLLHMDGVGNAFYDSSDPPGDNGFPILPAGVTVTPSGTFTTHKMKDGRNVWKFNGSTNYITISDHATWSMFLNDFTIAAWIKFDSIAANRTIIGQYTDANNQWYVKWTTSNIIQLYGITSSTARFDFTCPLTPVAGTWYHVVVQRSGSSCIMYINGVAQTVTQTTAFSATATDIAAVLSIGKINTEYQAGNTKDLQIFNKALTMDQVSALYQETYIY